MSHATLLLLVTAGALAVVAGCSRGSPDAAAATAETPKVSSALASSGNACDRKLLTADDVARLLSAPITGMKTIPGDPQSCEFTAASYGSVTVTLRPGLGKATVNTWKSGRMPTTAAPLPGVGDDAAWVNDLREVIAEKNDLLCDIQVTGLAGGPTSSTAVEQQTIGALCNKIFAAVH